MSDHNNNNNNNSYQQPQASSLPLLDNVVGEDIRKVADWLGQFRLPLELEEASTYLERLLQRTTLLTLYQHYFPTEWQTSSSTSTNCRQLTTTTRLGRGCTQAEIDFLELVDEQLFPIAIDWYQEVVWDGEFLTNVPVYTRDLDWWDGDVSDLDLGWQLLLVLTGNAESFSLKSQDPALLQLVAAQIRTNDRDSRGGYPQTLNGLCRQAKTPLKYLPLALDIIDHDTGCVMIDAHGEAPIEAAWDIESFDWLIAENKEAERIWHQAEQLISWLEAEPLKHFREVINLWKEAAATATAPTAIAPIQKETAAATISVQ